MSTDMIGERGESQMLQVPQVSQNLQQQTLPSPAGGRQQPPQSQPQPQAQQLATANGSAMLMQSAPHGGSTPNGSFPAIGQPSTGASDPQRAQQYSEQQRWLLFLRHASKCTASEGQCNISPHCHAAQQLWTHLGSCREKDCQYTRCNPSRALLYHYRLCTDSRCPVCGPVKQMINQKRPQSQSLLAQSTDMIGERGEIPTLVVGTKTDRKGEDRGIGSEQRIPGIPNDITMNRLFICD